MSTYEKARLIHIPHQKKTKKSYSSRCISKENIKQILRKAGYSDKEIDKLRQQGRIVIGTRYLSTKLKPGQKLYVLDIPEDHGIQEPVDRFLDIDLD